MSDYKAENISVLEGLQAVRKRPGMYIGNTDSEGLHSCLREIYDNSVDEFMANNATTVKVVIEKDGSAIVSDDGRGIPTDVHPKTGKSAVETIMTVLHAGGKFDQKNYKFSGGLHGVGASVVNALSENLEVWVLRDNIISYIQFKKGKTKNGGLKTFSLHEFKDTFPIIATHLFAKKSGTITKFTIDSSIFVGVSLNTKQVKTKLKQVAYLNKGLKVIFIDQREELNETYLYPDGIKQYLEDITKGETLISPIIRFEDHKNDFHLEAAMVYSSDYKEKMFAFTNGIINPEGGMHVTGLKTAITKVINNYSINKKLIKPEEKFTSDDLREGLRVILSVKMTDPQFTSQAKVKLGSTKARTFTDRIVSAKLEEFLEENPKEAQSIIQKAVLSMKARIAARAARESVMRKGALEGMSLPGKLADCSEKDPVKSEIFIVEGDSAGGSAKQGRDRETQAILPLFGKVLNTEKATLDKIMNYEGIKNMILAFGTGVGDKFDIEKLRYHKIILMTDADVDGAHITTLLLTFLYRYMHDLIEEGYVYLARPPLYSVKLGKKLEYVYSDPERDALVSKIRKEKPDAKIEIQRYKGLGEMNPEQLWDTTMDPNSRLLWQVTIGEAERANIVFQELMGADVAPRRKFIEENAVYADDIDLV